CARRKIGATLISQEFDYW
nr:immunoglobulin heavy chain junction region [Macaca mulatta]MOW21812.1 immunoglobulin heavy chain junction region [Macaca mulatta]MOW21938.1 immunoglobulin heavy chain junction region [Macaca mulatta]MOW22406.1 immunoglobulin heavy chain junction region [Macaca mulatta]